MKLRKRITSLLLSALAVFSFSFSAQSTVDVDQSFYASAYGLLTNQGTVTVIEVQPDGKILIGGQFTEVQGWGSSGVARLNADGTVDTTFVGPDLSGASFAGATIYAIAVQPDGKILIGGDIRIPATGPSGARGGIMRLNANGSVDTEFQPELLQFGSVVYDMELLADGKLLLGGIFTPVSSATPSNLCRFTANGALDTGFVPDVGGARIKDIELQPDGKMIVGGFTEPGVPVVRRFNSDGSPDAGFTSITTGSGRVEAVKLQTDGKIAIAGSFTDLNGAAHKSVSRLNANGTFDGAFTPGNPGADAIVNELEIRPDGKMIIAGAFSTYNGTPAQRIARLNDNGVLDKTYTSNVSLTGTTMNDIELLADNRVLAGLNASTSVDSMLRFTESGAIDPLWIVKATRGGTVHEVVRQPDGKLLIAGEFRYVNGVEFHSLARLNSDGSLDSSFVPYFHAQTPLPIIYALALQADGKIVVGSWHGFALTRLNPDGSQDTSFGTPFPSSSQVYDLAVQADGKILVGGNGMPTLAFYQRLNTDGTRDPGYNPPQPNWYVRRVLQQPDGKVLVGGNFGTVGGTIRIGITRYSSDGSMDTGFVPPTDVNFPVSDMALQTDGKIVSASNSVRRLNADGSLDVNGPGGNSEVTSMAIQADDKILVGGYFSVMGGLPRVGMARLGSDLVVDPDFVPTVFGGVNDIDVQPDGKLLITGAFSKIGDIPRGRIARLIETVVPQGTQFDYDGDGKSDVSVFRPSENRWYIFNSSNLTVSQAVFAIADDVPVPADYDGDLKTDIAIYRPSSGAWWYIASSSGQPTFVQWGGHASDVPMPSDYDGDGKADFVVYRASENIWYRVSGVTGSASNVTFGAAGDLPLNGDFDGDRKSDVAVYRPSNASWWYRSSIGNTVTTVRWGSPSDIAAPADFDGDGRTDIAVFRPSTGVWYVLNPTGPATILYFGLSEDKPVPADYDGDGKADIAVFRPSTGVWYLQQSTSGFTALQFGLSADIPTPNAYVP